MDINKYYMKEGTYQQKEYRRQRNELFKQFKLDAFKELGIENHPKKDKLFEIAWEEGHSSGYHDVWVWMEDLAELLT